MAFEVLFSRAGVIGLCGFCALPLQNGRCPNNHQICQHCGSIVRLCIYCHLFRCNLCRHLCGLQNPRF